MNDLISRQAAIGAILSEPPEAHYPAWYAEKIRQLPSAQPELDVHYGEMVNKHSFCDFVRDWMSKKLDPMAIRPEEMTHKMLYRSWVELWWLLDHYFEHELPKWGDEKDGEQ